MVGRRRHNTSRKRNVHGQFTRNHANPIAANDGNGVEQQQEAERSSNVDNSDFQCDEFHEERANCGDRSPQLNWEVCSEFDENLLRDTSKLIANQFVHNPSRCEKCLRESTDHIPLRFHQVEITSNNLSKKFGAPIRSRNRLNVCTDCQNYMQQTSRTLKWSFAWAAVFCTLLFYGAVFDCNGEYFFNLLPTSIAYSWLSAALEANYNIDTKLPLFNDFTPIRLAFVKLVEEKKATNLRYQFSFFSFPFVKCPAGCNVLINNTGSIDFSHLVAKLFPKLKGSSGKARFLSGMRSDFLKSTLHLDIFLSSPCLSVSDNGLQLLTCSLHQKTLNKNFIHPATSPLGSLLHPLSDRFALIATKLRSGTPCKLGNFSNTFTMATSVGGCGGISSIQLTTKRNLNAKSPILLPSSETLVAKNGIDVRNLLRRLVNKRDIDEDFFDFIVSGEFDISGETLDKHLSSSTQMTLFSMLSVDKILKDSSCSNVTLPPSLTICHSTNRFGAQPIFPAFKVATNLPFWISTMWNTNLEFFGHVIAHNCNNQEGYIKFLRGQVSKVSTSVDAGLTALRRTFNITTTDAQNLGEFHFLRLLLQKMPQTEVVLLERRSSLDNLRDHCSDASLSCSEAKALVVLCPQPPSRPQYFPQNFPAGGKFFQLVFLFCNKELAFIRYGGSFSGWWQLNPKLKIMDKVDNPMQQEKVAKSWKVLLFFSAYQNELTENAKSLFFSNQDSIYCRDHNKPLSVDHVASVYICSIPKCKRKAKWRCPLDHCVSCCCETHFKESKESLERTYIEPIESNDDNVLDFNLPFDTESSQMSSESEKSDEDYEFYGLNETGLFHQPLIETESTPYETLVAENCHETVPLHVMLNQALLVFKRAQKPKSLSRNFLRFFQNFSASNPEDVVSLLQAEALLAPSIFYKQFDDGSFCGALPYFLLNDDIFNHKMNFASFYDHLVARITNLELPVSSNIKYLYFLTDVLLNISLHKTVSTKFFKRGVQNIEIRGQKMESLDMKNFKHNLVDSERNVKELSAAMQFEMPKVFLTLTLNQKEHFGVAPIVEAIEKKFPDRTSECYRAAMQSYMPILLQVWNLTANHLLSYLMESPESMLGEVTNVWGRSEFQSSVGNFPHYHFLFWLKTTIDELKDVVASTKKHLFDTFHKVFYSNLGVIKCKQELNELLDKFIKIQTHDCDKGNRRCFKKRDSEGNLICRFPPYKPSNFIWLKEIPQIFSHEAVVILKKLGMILSFNDDGEVVAPEMQCFKYSYAASKGDHIMPNSPALFALTLSSGNVLFITSLFSSKYLNKYAAGKEEHSEVLIKSANSRDTIELQSQGIHNRKITGVEINLQEERKKERSLNGISGLTVSQTEFLWWSLKLPSIITTFDFVHVYTVPLEYRHAQFLEVKSFNGTIDEILTLREKLNLSSFAFFTTNQKHLIADNAASLLSCDNTIAFSLRPPELMCIDLMKLFHSCFIKKRIFRNLINVKLELLKTPRPWIDGRNALIQLRPAAINTIRDFLQSKISAGVYNHSEVNLLYVIDHLNDQNFTETYVSDSTTLSRTPAIVVFSQVFPKSGLKFLLHLLFSMGSFQTEIDLFSSTSLRECFIRAKVLPEGACQEVHALELLKRYVREQLIFLPGGNISFSNRLVAAYDAIVTMIVDDNFCSASFPCILMQNLTQKTEEMIYSKLEDTKKQIFEQLKPANVMNVPTTFNKDPAFCWIPQLTQLPQQSSRSYHEQCCVLDAIIKTILKYISSGTQCNARHILVLGKPGSGKSHVSSIGLLFALNNGLNCYVTSLAARRSSHFRCEHIHRLFCIGINSKDDASTAAEKAVKKISEKPLKRAIFLSLDVLLIEEIGLISSELLTTIDIILQLVRDSPKTFGGVLILANGDTNQLPSITGSDIFLSPSLLFSFDCHFLKFFVRMHDILGQHLLDCMSLKPILQDDIQNIVEVLSRECTFVESWDNVTDCTVMKVFGKKEAERLAVSEYQNKIARQGRPFVEFHAEDEMCPQYANTWKTATPDVQKFLDNECREPRKLVLHDNCVLKLTVNLEQLSQGQLCILAQLPNASDSSILIFVAPTVEAFTQENLIRDRLFACWPTKRVPKVTGFTHGMGNLSVRRRQLPFVNYVSGTCHKIMGDTFSKIATQVSVTEKSTTSGWRHSFMSFLAVFTS